MAKREVHDGIVTRNTDDSLGVRLRGGVYFESPTLFDGEYPVPAYPSFPFASNSGAGFFCVPKVGDKVEIEINVDDGTMDTSELVTPEPRWRCMIYDRINDIADEFKENYPYRMGWKSNSGHILLFEDSDGKESVSVISSGGHFLVLDDTSGAEQVFLEHKSGARLLFDQNGKISLKARAATRDPKVRAKDTFTPVFQELEMDQSKKQIKLYDHMGNILLIKESGVKITDKTGNFIDMSATGVKVNVKGKADIIATGKVTIKGAGIDLNGGAGAIGKVLTNPHTLSDFTGAPLLPGSTTVNASI